MQALLHGRLAQRSYALMLRSLFDIYAALEAGLARHAHHAAIATTFDPALFRRDGWDVRSVEVSHRPRRGGRSHYGMLNRLWVGIVDMAGVWWLGRRAVRTLDHRE